MATSAVTQPTTATITGTAGGATTSASLSVMPQGASTISGLTISPSSLTSGETGTGTVTLASPAAAGGAAVNLSSSGPAVTVPAEVTVPAGDTTATFPVTAALVTAPSSATITGSSANSASATVNVNPSFEHTAGRIVSDSCRAFPLRLPAVTSGETATGTVTLASPAPAGGVVVGLASNNQAATVPVSVTVPAGQTTATFPISTSAVLTPASATITAASANTEAAMLTVNPASSGQSAIISGFSIFTVHGIGRPRRHCHCHAGSARSIGRRFGKPGEQQPGRHSSRFRHNPSWTNDAPLVPVSTSTVSSSTTAVITATSANAMPATLTINHRQAGRLRREHNPLEIGSDRGQQRRWHRRTYAAGARGRSTGEPIQLFG